MAKKTHFFRSEKCKIHTSRCSCSKGCNYRNVGGKTGYQPEQAHHVLPVSTTIKYKSLKPYVGFVRAIDAVYRATDWCVNQPPNMKWLPLKLTYRRPANNKGGNRANPASVWGLDLPCHDWDHNCRFGYAEEVAEDFRRRIWNRIKADQQTNKCEFTPAKALEALAKLETHFTAKLFARGRRHGGTRNAILTRNRPGWWLPFSMANDKTAMGRPVAGFGVSPPTPRRKTSRK